MNFIKTIFGVLTMFHNCSALANLPMLLYENIGEFILHLFFGVCYSKVTLLSTLFVSYIGKYSFLITGLAGLFVISF